MEHIQTHYDTLKVARDAPTEVIKSAYRALARKYHPDSNPELEEAVKAMQALNYAFEVLIDPVQRKAHDEWIDQQSAETSSATNEKTKKTGKFPQGGEFRAKWPQTDKLAPGTVVGIIAVAAALIALVIIALEVQSRSSSKNSPSSEATPGLAASPTPTPTPASTMTAIAPPAPTATPTPTPTPRPALPPETVDIPYSEVELIPGIPNAWIVKNSLFPVDPNLPKNDPDKDGFTNIEEFHAGSNPVDGNSKPPTWTKLRLVSVKNDKLPIKFAALPRGDLETVQINTISQEDQKTVTGTGFYKKGDRIFLPDTRRDGLEVQKHPPLTLVEISHVDSFNPRMNSGSSVPVITLLNTSDGRKIKLPQGQIEDSPYSVATIKDIRPGGQEFALRTGQQFNLDNGQPYELIDVSEKSATIQSLASGERLSIPRLKPDPVLRSAPAATPNSDTPSDKTKSATSNQLLVGVWLRDSDHTLYQFLDPKHGRWGRNSKFTVTHNTNENTFVLDWGPESGWTNTLRFGADQKTLEGYTQHGDKFILKRISH